MRVSVENPRQQKLPLREVVLTPQHRAELRTTTETRNV